MRVFQRAFGVNVEDVGCTAGETYIFGHANFYLVRCQSYYFIFLFLSDILCSFFEAFSEAFLERKVRRFLYIFFNLKVKIVAKRQLFVIKMKIKNVIKSGNLKSLTSRYIR